MSYAKLSYLSRKVEPIEFDQQPNISWSEKQLCYKKIIQAVKNYLQNSIQNAWKLFHNIFLFVKRCILLENSTFKYHKSK